MPVAGHLFPFVPICVELQRRGHDVAIGLGTWNGGSVVVPGIETFPISLATPDHRALEGDKPRWAQLPTAGAFASYGEPLAERLREIMERENPAFVLIDPKLWGAMALAEAKRVPWAIVAHNPLFFRGLGVDPRGPGWPPPRTLAARLRRRLLRFAMNLETQEHLAEVNRVRKRLSLPPFMRLDELYTSPPLVLATTAEPFEYPRSDWPASLKFVGPMVWDTPDEEPFIPDSADPRPVILVAGSTIAPEPRFAGWAEAVLDALSDEPFRVVATLPSERLRTVPGGPARPERKPFSHMSILPHTSCVICHGGPGIVQKALWYGVPVVAVPFAYDRFEVARRVVISEAGVMLSAAELTPVAIRAAVRTAMLRAEGAARVGTQFRAAGGAPAAADAIEAQLT